jgi:hypothetical protein
LISGRRQATALFAGRKELFRYFGTAPQTGSLNVVLDLPILLRPERAAVRFEDHRLGWSARLDGHACLVHRWPNCPLHIVELISPHRFRMQKGQPVFVEFNTDDLQPVRWRQFLGWGVLWSWGRSSYYSNDKYCEWSRGLEQRFPGYFRQQHLDTGRST